MAKAPAKKSAAKTEAKGPKFTQATEYAEIADGDGVIRVEPGAVVVEEFGLTLPHPIERFREKYPDIDPA